MPAKKETKDVASQNNSELFSTTFNYDSTSLNILSLSLEDKGTGVEELFELKDPMGSPLGNILLHRNKGSYSLSDGSNGKNREFDELSIIIPSHLINGSTFDSTDKNITYPTTGPIGILVRDEGDEYTKPCYTDIITGDDVQKGIPDRINDRHHYDVGPVVEIADSIFDIQLSNMPPDVIADIANYERSFGLTFKEFRPDPEHIIPIRQHHMAVPIFTTKDGQETAILRFKRDIHDERRSSTQGYEPFSVPPFSINVLEKVKQPIEFMVTIKSGLATSEADTLAAQTIGSLEPVLISTQLQLNKPDDQSVILSPKETLLNKEVTAWPTPDSWHGIIGQKDAIAKLQEIINANSSLGEWGPVIQDRGFLLYGPPGTGKSSLAKVVAEDMGATLIHIGSDKDTSEFKGGNVVKAREKFELAKKAAKEGKKVVILIDEIEEFTTAKSGSGGSSSPDTNGYMGLIEEVMAVPKTEDQFRSFYENKYGNIIVIGTTNVKDKIEKAVLRPGRLAHKIECFLPRTNQERRDLVVNTVLPTMRMANAWRLERGQPQIDIDSYFGFTDIDLIQATQDLAGFSQAEIDSGTRMALSECVRRKNEGESDYKISLDELIVRIYISKERQHIIEEETIVKEDLSWPLPTRWHGIIGQNRAVTQLQIIADKIKNPDPLEGEWGEVASNRGLLFWGPTGTGKTSLAKAMAEELQADFFELDAGDVTFEHVGLKEEYIRQKFEEAKGVARTGKRVVMIFNEVESLTAKKTRPSGINASLMTVQQNETNAVMTMVEKVLQTPKTKQDKEEFASQGLGNIVIIGTTNHKENMEDAAKRPKRFGNIVECGIPTTNQERLDLILNATMPTISSANHVRQSNNQELLGFADYFGFTYQELLERCEDLRELKQAEIEGGVEAALTKLLSMKKTSRSQKLSLTDLINEISHTLEK